MAKEPPLPMAADDWKYKLPQILTPSARRILRDQVISRIDSALPVFISALKDNVAAIKAEERAKAEWAAALVDIFFGLGAPIISRLLINRGGLTQRLATSLSGALTTKKTAKHAAAAKQAAEAAAKVKPAVQAAADATDLSGIAENFRRKTAAAAAARNNANAAANAAAQKGSKVSVLANARADRAARRAAELQAEADAAAKAYSELAPVQLISDQEFLKEGVKGIGKLVTTGLKQNVTALFGEDSTAVFARGLEAQFQQGAVQLKDKIIVDREESPEAEGQHVSDKDLLAMWAAYDPEVANPFSYAEALKKLLADFMTFVTPIGEEKPEMTQIQQWHHRKTRGVWMRDVMGRKSLFVIDERLAGPKRSSDARRVPPALVPFVIKRTEEEFGAVETIDDWALTQSKASQENVKRLADAAAAKRAEEEARRKEAAEERRRAAEARRKEAAARRKEEEERRKAADAWSQKLGQKSP